MIKKKKDRYYI